MMIYKPFFAPNSDYKYRIFYCKMQIINMLSLDIVVIKNPHGVRGEYRSMTFGI